MEREAIAAKTAWPVRLFPNGAYPLPMDLRGTNELLWRARSGARRPDSAAAVSRRNWQAAYKIRFCPRPQRAKHGRHQLGYVVSQPRCSSAENESCEYVVLLLRRWADHGPHPRFCDPRENAQS